MHDRTNANGLSNDELIGALGTALQRAGALVASVIAMLMEVEERRLHLELACSSMFDFCTRRLGMSEGEAYRRITVARLAKRFPEILEAVRSRRVHLSSLVLLRDVLTRENVADLLDAAAGKTKGAVQQLVARLAPKPDVPAIIRKLPRHPATAIPTGAAATRADATDAESTRPLAGSTPPHTTGATASLPSTAGEGPSCSGAGAGATRADAAGAGAAGAGATRADAAGAGAAGAGAAATRDGAARAMTQASSSPLLAAASGPRSGARDAKLVPVAAQLTPLAESRHKVQFTASSALREKLERARSLMRHRNVDGDLAVVVERAMDLLIAKLESEKLAATTRAPSKATPKVGAGVAVDAKRGAAIPAETRREVIQRDGEQCAFVGSNGERCPARDFLELDHRHPRALGGTHDARNLQLLCRSHNQHAAERVFGRDHIARIIDVRRRKQRTARASAMETPRQTSLLSPEPRA